MGGAVVERQVAELFDDQRLGLRRTSGARPAALVLCLDGHCVDRFALVKSPTLTVAAACALSVTAFADPPSDRDTSCPTAPHR